MVIKCHLYEYRNQKGLSLQNIHDMTGFSKSYLDYLENNEKLPRIDYAYKLSKIFNISVYELFEIVND